MVGSTKGHAIGITAGVQYRYQVYSSEEGAKTSPAPCYLKKRSK